jgi:hypothetical protein
VCVAMRDWHGHLTWLPCVGLHWFNSCVCLCARACRRWQLGSSCLLEGVVMCIPGQLSRCPDPPWAACGGMGQMRTQATAWCACMYVNVGMCWHLLPACMPAITASHNMWAVLGLHVTLSCRKR